MDKIDDRYKNGKIYDITSNITDMVYIGSCIVTLNRRLLNHKSQKKQTCSSKYIIECGDYNINLIEEYSCNNLDQLRKREQYWIDKYKSEGKNVVNEQNAYRSKEQRLEYQREYIKEYRENNREDKNRKKISEYNKEWYVKNREKMLERNKQNYANNRDKQKELNKEYYFMNKKEYVNACYEFLEMLKHY